MLNSFLNKKFYIFWFYFILAKVLVIFCHFYVYIAFIIFFTFSYFSDFFYFSDLLVYDYFIFHMTILTISVNFCLDYHR